MLVFPYVFLKFIVLQKDVGTVNQNIIEVAL